MAKVDLKKFRHDVSTLKKRGLLSGVDARSAVPSGKSGAKLRRLISRYDDVLSGKVSPVKLDRKGLAEYKAMGKPFEVVRPKGLPARVLIPHSAGERVTVTHGKVKVSSPGVSRTILPVKYTNLESYLQKLSEKKVVLKDGEQLAFRFFDNRSWQTFDTMDDLIDYLGHYETVFDAIDENDSEAMQEIYQNLEIVRVDQPSVEAWKSLQGRGGHRSRSKSRSQFKYRERKRALKAGPEYKREEYRRQQAERQAAWRERLKGAKLAKYQAAGRRRAKKSKKGKKGKK